GVFLHRSLLCFRLDRVPRNHHPPLSQQTLPMALKPGSLSLVLLTEYRRPEQALAGRQWLHCFPPSERQVALRAVNQTKIRMANAVWVVSKQYSEPERPAETSAQVQVQMSTGEPTIRRSEQAC